MPENNNSRTCRICPLIRPAEHPVLQIFLSPGCIPLKLSAI